ncbi:methyl-accepting chemotaxis protein [Mangrovibrevibacter kandeliae]|uniref:methyl-accepting chemotaxis protein n=1 Tax=Mangrovibrevibacter kandeliae TaxID=2968473 RepID=UPI0021177E69|nr:methyl-accepting chemotaxis protein [Aurantimonas sp. CSK15Z-1]MCQ8783647.1 methyl-accepting chemotaxis protein [Aurantimonas sp. CSK15Z-1]
MIGLAFSGYSARQLSSIDTEYSHLLDVRGEGLLSLARASRSVSGIAYDSYKAMAYDGASSQAKAAAADRDKQADAVRERLGIAMKAFPEQSEAITALSALTDRIDQQTKSAVAQGLADREDEARQLLATTDQGIDAFIASTKKLTDQLLADNRARSDDLSTTIWNMILLTLGGSLLAGIFGIVGALVISSRGITGPLDQLRRQMEQLAANRLDTVVTGAERSDEVGAMAKTVETFKQAAIKQTQLEAEAKAAREAQAAERERQQAGDRRKAEELKGFVADIGEGFASLAEGDLTVRMERPVAAEFEPIRAQFNQSTAALEETLGGVMTGVSSIRTGLDEINTASNDLAQRTEQQAASLEQTVAALSEVTRGVNQTAEGAARAQTSAQTAQKNAEKGGAIVGRAVEAMQAIEQSSEQIGKIIGVIDEIAFQTNLLALNAGVEAARAGEAGKGFAVVAQEVRGLAQRSAEAAKEIKDLISTSSSQVEEGVELVSASGKSLEEIVAQVAAMSSEVSEIARSAREQAISLKEVSTAADQMDKVTQQNAAMVEEATAAAQTLANETDELARLIARFKTAASSGHQQQARRAASRSTAASPARPAAPAAAPRPVAQLRTVGSGGAARKPAEDADSWAEF